MRQVDIIVPVKNEEHNLEQLIVRVNTAMVGARLPYRMIFIDDKSTDRTVEVLNSLKESYPITVYSKLGKVGKAYSILEGVKYSNAEYVAMLDADLQYPPEAIPEMFEKAHGHGVIVANRKEYEASKLRKFVSKSFSFGFGRLLHGFKVDVQSGLKLFRREILSFIEEKDVSPWTLDLSLLRTARDLGFKIGSVDITFDKRTSGQSKVNLLKTSLEIGKNALKLKFKKKKIYHLPPFHPKTMIGAGIVHNKKWLRTHTTLKAEHSAIKTFNAKQISLIILLVLALEVGLILNPIMTVIGVVGILSFIYFIDVVFNLYVVLKSLHFPPEISSTSDEISQIKDEELPVYTILCPLYREAHILPYFLEAMEKLDYPKNKLDVKLLLEEDDTESLESVKKMILPKYVSTLIVPDSEPKTKPKACNYGLNFATGEYLVIYDAEDLPEADQLKKAYLAFKKLGPNTVCLQAKLNYFNHNQNLLTRFFTAEYSLWFEVMLTGLQSIDTVIPLGGTSNHFRTKTLLELEGWDSFNVTEDCDLGVRLFKKGYKTAVIDSTTWEEANSKAGNWLRQRSRWIKGYMQTYLVHMRNPIEFIKTNGWHSFVFQLIIGARISFMLINPILWATTFAYFAFYSYTSAFIESIFPNVVFYLAVSSLIFGNFLYIFNYMIGCAKKGHWSLIKYIYLIPLYWLMASLAACIALYQLIVKPHYWEKTVHGLHLAQKKVVEEIKEKIEEEVKEVKEEIIPEVTAELTKNSWYKKITLALSSKRAFFISAIFIAASLVTGVLNLGFNIYLGRVINFEDLALITLINGLLYFSNVPQISLTNTVTHKVGFLEGKGNSLASTVFFNQIARKFLFISIVITGVWMALIPVLKGYFNLSSILPLFLFSPVWIFGIGAALYKGVLAGKLLLERLALILILDPVIKFAVAWGLINYGYSDQVYLAIPASIIASLFFAVILTSKFLKQNNKVSIQPTKKDTNFPLSFFIVSSLSVIAPMTFLSLDVLLAKHYLPDAQAGQYALISLVGKIIYFLGVLVPQLILPFVSRNEGANKNSEKILALIFLGTAVFTGFGYLFFGRFSNLSLPLLFGEKVLAVLPLFEPFAFAMVCFSLSQIFVSYYLAKKIYTFPIVSFFLAIVQFGLIYINHADVEAIVFDMFLVSLFSLLMMSVLHFFAERVKILESNINDFFGLFAKSPGIPGSKNKNLRILILNWRDTKHIWAGGAESYLHELSKVWISQGIKVTIFCGNDGKHPRNEVIDGVQVVRRGGFYTVYVWAFLYYVLKFRGKFDMVIDSANGIPFFTPFYVGVPKYLLIYHVHQEVFREHLLFGLSHFARFLEAKLMPMVYKNHKMITISDSTRDEMARLKFTQPESIDIVHPGVSIDGFKKMEKNHYPTFLYLGRLQPYKNVEVAIKAFGKVLEKYSSAKFQIAGFGESLKNLQLLVSKLGIENSVEFLGRVDEMQKRELMAKAWVMIQPSMLEGWGITVIEANAAGTTVIASDVNGLRDSIVQGSTGILVKPKSVEEFAEKMIWTIEYPEDLKKLSEQAYSWSQKFSWENSANKFLTIIKDRIKERSYRNVTIEEVAYE